ncbi:hypothetical protein WJX73_007749 [Symbiochloris irregularis]|uniref:Translin-associated factor X-interacting protein 1 N-terminal domain-containing protein n=1 Tax=Symbiochloris irregularis TaxID=706552 RepID=A0AAW1NRI0_9CHLO
MSAAVAPSAEQIETIKAKSRFKRSKLPPDPSSTLLQGVFLTVPPRGHVGPAKLLPGNTHSPMDGPMSLGHDVSYRLDATSPGRMGLSIRSNAQNLSTSMTPGDWSRSIVPGKNMSGRRETLLLRQWMQAEMEAFNSKWGRKGASPNVVEFVVLAQKAAHSLYTHTFSELARQVAVSCQDRADLLTDLWQSYSSMVDNIVNRLVEQHSVLQQKCLNSEGSNKATFEDLETVNRTLQQENIRHKEQITELQEMSSSLARKSKDTEDNNSPLRAMKNNRSFKRIDTVRASNSSVLSPRDRATGESVPSGGVQRADSGVPPISALAKRRTGAPVGADAVRFGAKRASMMAGALLQSLQTAQDEAEDHRSTGGAAALRSQNQTLTAALEESRKEMGRMLDQITELERAADDMVGLESRVQVAEGERDVAVGRLVSYTPRPSAALGGLSSLGPDISDVLTRAMATFRTWPPEELARMLIGEAAGPQTCALEAAPHAFACMQTAVKNGRLSRNDILQAIDEQKGPGWWLDYVPQASARWLGQHVLVRDPEADPNLLVDFLVGISEAGNILAAEYYGCLQAFQPAVTWEMCMATLEGSHEPTNVRMARAEEHNRRLQQEVEEARAELAAQIEADRLREEGRKRRDEEAKLEKRNQVDALLEMLMAAEVENGESFLHDGFSGIGAGIDIHKLLRTNGFVRNRRMSKRETEKLVKEVWKAKMSDEGGQDVELIDFLYTFLQKRHGLQSAIIETGYNLVYWLWKYSFDADCDLFLKILRGEVREDVYVSQKTLQDELEAVFRAADKAANRNRETGVLKKEDVMIALKNYFCMGQPGGKSLDRFDTLMSALDKDQPGTSIEHGKVFEEDREFNQGAFAECVREQWLQERLEYFSELEAVIYHEAMGQDECDRGQVITALMKVDANLIEKQALALVETAFMPGADKHTVKLVLRRLRAGAGRTHPTPIEALGTLARPKGKKAAPPPPLRQASGKKADGGPTSNRGPTSSRPGTAAAATNRSGGGSNPTSARAAAPAAKPKPKAKA